MLSSLKYILLKLLTSAPELGNQDHLFRLKMFTLLRKVAERYAAAVCCIHLSQMSH